MNLNQITVPSINVPQSIVFYQQLGLRLIVHTHDAYARFECPDGTSTFSIHAVDQLPTGSGVMVYFECEHLDAQVAHLIEKGIVFSELPNDKSWLWREAHLNDPDGNHLILYHAGDNRRNPPWRGSVFGGFYAATAILLYLFRYSTGVSPVIFLKILRNALVSV